MNNYYHEQCDYCLSYNKIDRKDELMYRCWNCQRNNYFLEDLMFIDFCVDDTCQDNFTTNGNPEDYLE